MDSAELNPTMAESTRARAIPKQSVQAHTRRTMRFGGLIVQLGLLLAIAKEIAEASYALEAVERQRLLKALCAGRHVELHTADDLDRLVVALDDLGLDFKCPPHVERALRSLSLVVRDTRACTMDKAEAISAYSREHLSGMELPKSLYHFAVAYGLKVSSICRHHLLERWLPVAEAALLDYHFEQMSDWLDHDSAVSRLLEPLLSRGDFLLPSDLWAAMPDDTLKRKFTLRAQGVTNGETVYRAKQVCLKWFAPLYKPMILPLAHLMRAGFFYEDLFLKEKQYLYSKRAQQFEDWSKVVFVCEILETMGDGQKPPVDHRDELDLFNEVQIAARREGRRFAYAEAYKTDHVQVDKQILSELDLPLWAAVAAFDPKLTPVRHLRAQILKRSWKLLSTEFKYGKFRTMIRAACKKIMRKIYIHQGNSSIDAEMEIVNQELLDVLGAKNQSRLYKFAAGAIDFGRAFVGGLAHFVVTVTLLFILLALVLVPMKPLQNISGQAKEQFEIMVE